MLMFLNDKNIMKDFGKKYQILVQDKLSSSDQSEEDDFDN